MNVLANAKHRVGIRTAILVFGFIVAMGTVFLAANLYFKYPTGSVWALSLVCIDVASVACPMAAYFLARRNPELLRKELQGMIRGQEDVLFEYEKHLTESLEELRRLEQDQRSEIEKAWIEGLQKEKEEALPRLQKAVGELREIDSRTSPKQKILNQEYFLQIHKQLRESEELASQLENVAIPPLPEKIYREISLAAKKEFDALRDLIETRVKTLQVKISASREIIFEAQRILRETQ